MTDEDQLLHEQADTQISLKIPEWLVSEVEKRADNRSEWVRVAIMQRLLDEDESDDETGDI